MTYTLYPGGAVMRDADRAFLPSDPSSPDVQAYQAWIAAGNTATPGPQPAAVAPYLCGQDIIDAMSPAQDRNAAVDPRDLLRIQGRHPADTVKSKIARVETALGLAAGTLSKQATATGGL